MDLIHRKDTMKDPGVNVLSDLLDSSS